MSKNFPVLEVTGLTVVRDGTPILHDVAWRVERGEHWVILGANGSGKTSLLSALTGYLSPTEGEISVLGETYGESDWRELRRKVGLVSSSIRQLMADAEPALTTVISGKYAMIDYWGEISAADRAAGRRLLAQVEAGHLAARPWRVLSQGERQRVLIGRALMARPRLLILDEPCAGLDPLARENFLGFLQRLGAQRGGPALILVTHHIEEIMPAFTHALLLRAGAVLAAGPSARTLTSARLAEVFGAPCRLRKRDGRYGLEILMRLLFLLLTCSFGLRAEPPPASPAVREIAPGVFGLGEIRIEQTAKLLTFPAKVNMDKGALEYLITGKRGPTHESLLVTDTSAFDLHLAMLLLGARKGEAGAGAAPGQLNAEYLRHAPALAGDRISMELAWQDAAGLAKTAPPEDWVFQASTKKAAARGPWLYSGSQFGATGRFQAEEQDVVAALVTNPAALINNPRPGHEDDQIWGVNEKAIPPVGTAVTVTLRLLPAP